MKSGYCNCGVRDSAKVTDEGRFQAPDRYIWPVVRYERSPAWWETDAGKSDAIRSSTPPAAKKRRTTYLGISQPDPTTKT